MKSSNSTRSGDTIARAPAQGLCRRHVLLLAGAASFIAACGGGGGGGNTNAIAPAALNTSLGDIPGPTATELRALPVVQVATSTTSARVLACTGLRGGRIAMVWCAPLPSDDDAMHAGLTLSTIEADGRVGHTTLPPRAPAAIAATIGPEGEVAIVWRDVVLPDPAQPLYEHRSIRMQRYSAIGTANGDEQVLAQQAYNPLFNLTETDLVAPAIAMRRDGSHVVAWARSRSTGGTPAGAQVEARRYDAAGQAIGTIEMVGFNECSSEFRMHATDGGGLLVCVPARDATSRTWLRALQWHQQPAFELPPSSPPSMPWASTHMQALAGGGLLSVSERDEGRPDATVYGRDGRPAGSPLALDGAPDAAVALATGGHALLWAGAASGWRARLHDVQGQPSSGEIAVTQPSAHALPTATADGGLAFAWTEVDALGRRSLKVQRFEA